MRSFVCVLTLSVVVWAAALGSIRGIVHDPQHRPVAGAQLTIQAAYSQWHATAASNASGEFSLDRVPIGDYIVTVRAKGFRPLVETVTVTTGVAPILHFELAIASAEQTTTVTATAPVADVESSTPTTAVSRLAIARTPGASRANSLAVITDFVPGAYIVHDQLHVRGGHQVSWLVDGVPVPNTNIASNVGPQFNPQDMDYLEAQRGSYDAEYGDRTYGVFNVIPRTGFERDREADLTVTGGNFGQTNDQFNFGGHTDTVAYYASLSGNRSSLGLETPTAPVLHDATNGLGGFQSVIYNLDPKDQFRLIASQRTDFYQIPNTPGQEAAGDAQRLLGARGPRAGASTSGARGEAALGPAPNEDAQKEGDSFANLSWVRTINSSAVLTISPFYHFNRADYDGGPDDYPIATTDQRASLYYGGQATLQATAGPNSLELGAYGFTQRDHHFFGLRFNDGSSPTLSQTLTAAGNLEEAFAEDKYQPRPWLTLMGGLRASRFAGSFTETALSPRLGLAVRLPWLHWVARGNYGRYYQPPPLETASGPLLQFVTGQNLGFIPLRGERDEEWQAGLTIPVRGWALDGDFFHNRAANFFDHNNVGNSDIFFPLTIATARIYGFEATLRSPQLWHRGGVHLAYSNQIAEGAGSITGGLTDFSPPSGWFLLDHDQRNTLSVGTDLTLPASSYASANVTFDSGFANGDAPPAHLPGHAELDLAAGRDFGERWSLGATALNVTNRHLLTDNSFTFGGTHWNNPREFYLQLRYRFHY